MPFFWTGRLILAFIFVFRCFLVHSQRVIDIGFQVFLDPYSTVQLTSSFIARFLCFLPAFDKMALLSRIVPLRR